jgi:hypothetical protein
MNQLTLQKPYLPWLTNLGEYIHDNSPQYMLIEDDPRNEDDYDSWTYGMEVHCLKITLGSQIQLT